MMRLLTTGDINVRGKRVLLRADLNVSFDTNGNIADDFRVRALWPTIKYLRERDAAVLIFSHLGRPEGKRDPRFTLAPIAKRLEQLLETPVRFVNDCIGSEAQAAAKEAGPGSVTVFENLRFHAGEEENDPAFAEQLAELGDVVVNDAFGASHRPHASIAWLPKLKLSVAGLLLQKEVDALTKLRDNPERPLAIILGGAKISNKLPLIERLLPKADSLCLGGALANTVLKAKGLAVGRSVVEEEMVERVKPLALTDTHLHLPVDVVVSRDRTGTLPVEVHGAADVRGDELILDIGPDTIVLFENIIRKSKTVFWNGPLGLAEVPAFADGTKKVARVLAATFLSSVVGGGDLTVILDQLGLIEKFGFVSTGGGEMLEFLAGMELPGITALS